MNLLATLRLAFLCASATWLGLAGVAVPCLFALEDGRGDLAAWHVIILSTIALAAIIFLTKPAAFTTKGKP
jgi:hypothetical protein